MGAMRRASSARERRTRRVPLTESPKARAKRVERPATSRLTRILPKGEVPMSGFCSGEKMARYQPNPGGFPPRGREKESAITEAMGPRKIAALRRSQRIQRRCAGREGNARV
jgi:hypothetical protein